MKNVKDIFSRSIGWDVTGVMCSFCRYSKGTRNFETKKVESVTCTLHHLNLKMQVSKTGHVKGEYFCKQFDNVHPFPTAVEEFEQIKNELEENILYEACQKEYLCMTSFEEIEKVSD